MIIIHHTHYKYWLGILASIFLGMTFIVAGSGKLLGLPQEFGLPEVVLTGLVVAELIIGVLLVAGIFVKPVAGLSLLFIAGFITSNILMKTLGLEECLSCFGALGELSIIQALWLDGVMVALAVTILTFYPAKFFEVRPWFWGKND